MVSSTYFLADTFIVLSLGVKNVSLVEVWCFANLDLLETSEHLQGLVKLKCAALEKLAIAWRLDLSMTSP
jgi:hypothetical protein